ncbi:MAG TPA: DUF2461 family protein [Streptosporangiaceae bacterium]|nr:DUF2461 family protein [Streptosporangiaceae bacterium]
MTSTGFPAAGLALLARLPTLDKAGFAAEHTRWQDLVLQPSRRLVQNLGALLTEQISPGLITDDRVNGSIAPVNRNLRFDPHGARYKDHLLFRWWEGAPKKTAPTLYMRLGATQIGFASGVVFASTDHWRATVGDLARARTLCRLVDDISRATPSADIAGADLKRVPAPFTTDHPGADLLRHGAMFQLRWAEPLPAEVSAPAFIQVSAARLARLAGLHRWLVTEAGA